MGKDEAALLRLWREKRGETRPEAVPIPREFELPGENAIIRKEGQRLIIEAAPPRSPLATLPTLDEDFVPIEDLPAEPVDL
jgi:antitoxin VapB